MTVKPKRAKIKISKTERAVRSCGFCDFKAPYDEFPDGSVCFEGVCACADCLKTEKTATFRLLLDEEATAYNRRFEEKKTYGQSGN